MRGESIGARLTVPPPWPSRCPGSRSFVELAQNKSFDKTAKAVGRSQPAITDQIRTLEETLGVSLFHRQTRSVSLTLEGEALFHRVQGILRDLDDLLLDFAKVAALEVGEVRVGATPTLACYIVPEIIGSFRRKYPGIRIMFSDAPAAQLEADVENRKARFLFRPEAVIEIGAAFSIRCCRQLRRRRPEGP